MNIANVRSEKVPVGNKHIELNNKAGELIDRKCVRMAFSDQLGEGYLMKTFK